MSNKFFKSFFALALVVGSALGFVACEELQQEVTNPTVEVSVKSLTFSNEEEAQSVEITANGDWKVTVDYLTGEDWIIVTPMAGNGNTTISVAVPMNNSGAIREATIKVIALHPVYGNWDVKKIKVAQSSTETPPVAEALLYGDNFDGKKATKEYGSSNNSWPYIDQFPEFANAEGPASENVTYSGSGVSVRANSESNGGYSDYAGSGANNIFFGGGAYFQINTIALDASQLSYKMTFGSEKYTQDGDSTFKNEEFLLYISKDGLAWAPVEYTFAGTEPGRWNVATANFTLAAGTEVLYVKFEAKVASVYRLDDVKLFTGNGGQTIDLDNIEEPTPVPPTTEALYFENFDGKAAQKDGNYWPYVTDFPDMKNAVGPAAANVSYDGHNTTVRNNSNSDGSYSDYAGSGVNNIFFGKVENHFTIKELALESSQKNLILTFGTEKYSQSLGSLFKPEEFIVSLSGDGEKWTSIDYTFAGTAEGRWNVATANFTLKEAPAKLYIKFSATAESAYRLDDVTLNVGEGGQEVDLAAGVAGGGDNPGGGNDDPAGPNVPSNGAYESDSAFVCTTDDSTNSSYGHKDTKIGGEAVTGFKLGTGSKSGYFKSGAVGVDGDKYLNFYAVAWKGKSATLYVRVDGGEAISFELNAHVGATGNPPYTALTAEDQDHYSVKLEGLTASSTVEFSTDASFSAVANDASGRAIVFGVKLTDEALAPGEGGGNEPVNPEPEPEPTPDEVITIADVLALGQGATIDGAIECVVISDCTIENLTSKKGMYVQDDTAALQLRLAADHEFAFGTKVKIDLTGCKLGEYGGAVQVDGIALDKVTTISTGNSVVAKTVSIADFLANKYEGQYIAIEGVQVADSDLARTWVEGEKHTSINIEDAQGNKFIVFSSKYATYGAQKVAQGSGTIKGISSINNGNMQIIFAQVSDFAGLTGARFGADNEENEGGSGEGNENEGGSGEGNENEGGSGEGNENEGGSGEGNENEGGSGEGNDNEGGSGEGNENEGGSSDEGEVATSVVFDIASYTFEDPVLTSYTVDPITFAFDGGSNVQNVPKYFANGAAVRCYSGNTITISGKTITSVEVVTVDKTDLALYDGDTKLDNFTWTGSSDNVVLTFDPTTAKGHTRFTSIKVTYAE